MFKPPTPGLGRAIQDKQRKLDDFRRTLEGVIGSGYEVAAITNGTDLSKQVLEIDKTVELWEDILVDIPPSFEEHLFLAGCWCRFFAAIPNWQAPVKGNLFRDEFVKVHEGVYDEVAAWAAREQKNGGMGALEFLKDDLEDVTEPVDWLTVLRESLAASDAETNDWRAPEEVWEMVQDVAPFINLYGNVRVIEKLARDLEDMDKSMEEKFPSWFPIVVIFIFLLAFGLGAGPIPWFIVSEMFPPSIRPPAASAVSVSNWTLAFIVIQVFPYMQDAMKDFGCFMLFAVCSFVGTVFGLFYVKNPEVDQDGFKQYDDLASTSNNFS